MHPWDFVTAWFIQQSAPYVASYGRDVHVAGADLPKPEQHRIPTRHGRVRVHVYRPRRAQAAAPVYLHLHGGALLMRYPQMDDFFCRYVASETDAAVVNVDFAVAPQHSFPVAHHQAHDIGAWIAEHGDTLGLDGSRIAVSGFSTGAALATSACLQARDRGTFAPALQVLGVPALDNSDAALAAAPTGLVSTELRALVRRAYFPDPDTRTHPYASPLLAPDLGGLPPAVVLTAERDSLRPEGDRYAARLRAAGVDVLHDVTPDADHYFLSDDRERAADTLALLATEIRRRCARPLPQLHRPSDVHTSVR